MSGQTVFVASSPYLWMRRGIDFFFQPFQPYQTYSMQNAEKLRCYLHLKVW